MNDFLSLTNGLLIFIIGLLFRITRDIAKVKEHIKVCPHITEIFK